MICSQSVFLLLSTRQSMAGLTPPTLTRNSLARYLKLLQLIPPFPVPNNKNLATFHTLLIGSFMVNDRYSNFIIPNISHCSLLVKNYKILSTAVTMCLKKSKHLFTTNSLFSLHTNIDFLCVGWVFSVFILGNLLCIKMRATRKGIKYQEQERGKLRTGKEKKKEIKSTRKI